MKPLVNLLGSKLVRREEKRRVYDSLSLSSELQGGGVSGCIRAPGFCDTTGTRE